MKYIDIGVNLFSSQFSDPRKIICDAKQAGVRCILTGTDMDENNRIASFIKNNDVYATAGIHPHNADDFEISQIDDIRDLILSDNKFVAVGECGLDYDRMFSKRENQLSCFRELIKLAESLKMPLFLHERSANQDFINCFDGYEEVCKRSVVHCFTEGKDVLLKYLEMGFYIGITGWICDSRRGQELRDAVKYIPLDRVLLETDSPYLVPKNIKGLNRTNVPENIKYVAAELAKNMEVEEEILVENAYKNTKRIFDLD